MPSWLIQPWEGQSVRYFGRDTPHKRFPAIGVSDQSEDFSPARCQHYGYTPLLLETLVDVTGFNGTCYRAANWIALGETPAEEEWIVTTKRLGR